MSTANDSSAARPGAGDAVSRPELERLAARRRRPAAAHTLTPPGMEQVTALLDRQGEERIRRIETRLNAAQDRAVVDFALGQNKDKARRGFERER